MKKVLTIIIALSLHLTQSWAKEQYIFTQVSHKEGFTSTVNCIYKETDGNVWIGSPVGLYTFDGYSLKHHADTLLAGRKIFRIEEDVRGNLWILTDNWPLLRRKGESAFTLLKLSPEKRTFNSICMDEEGVWLGSTGRLYRYDYVTDKMSAFTAGDNGTPFGYKDMILLDSGKLLCSSLDGIIMIDPVTGEVSESSLGSSKEVSAAMTDSEGNIWLALYNNGIEVYDQQNKLLHSYNTSNSALSNNVVLCFTERDGRIWAGTNGGGINIIDPEEGRITVLSHVSGNPASFPAQSIKSIYTDTYGNIWAGSMRDGLIQVSSSEMKTYSESHFGTKAGMSNTTVLCLHQDPESRFIWIGTDGDGINRFDPESNEFTHYRSTANSKVVSITDFSKDELALSIYSEGIIIFNKNTGQTRPLTIKDEDLIYKLRYTSRSIGLNCEPDGKILVHCKTVKRLDPKTGLSQQVDIGGNPLNNDIHAIGKTPTGIWAHDSRRIFFLKYGAAAAETSGTLEETVIRSGYICEKGLIWLATDNGLYCFDPAQGKFTHISTTLFSNATSVVCDRNSRIWVGTDLDVFAYLTESESFAMFGESDGAQPNEYLSKPRLLSREGDVYMGGVYGLLRIDRNYTIEELEVPRLGLNEILVDGQPLDEPERNVFLVPHHSYSMTISVATQEKDIFRNKMYRFSFSNGGPVFEKPAPTVNIRQLPPPGRYVISVSCTKRNGNWTEPVEIATIRIQQPWYLSGWFIGGTLFLILAIIGTVPLLIAYRKANMLQLALKEQEQRVYEEKVQMLINVSHELRTPLTLIMAPLKRILNDKDASGKYSETLGRIYRQSRRMKDMLNIVLDLRKMEVGKNSLKIESINFNKWLESSIEDIIAEEHAEGIDIMLETDPAITEVDMDVRKCDTVLMNILINAIKHSAIGDTITIKTRLSGEGSVIVSVSDQGPGLRDADMSQLFTNFYQSSHEQYGSGIGLSYSKILIELMGGKIGAHDNEDKGATFWWEIPVTAEFGVTPVKAYLNELLGYDPGEEIVVPETRSIDTSGMTLMLVDDNADLLDFLKESLHAEFREIILASSGNKAMKIIESGKVPDLIVSDVNMSDGDGYKLCKEIKDSEKFSHIPVVLLSAHRQEESQNESYKIGAEAFLPKPFEIDTLLELVRNILARKAEIKKMYLKADNEGSYSSKEEGFILQLNRVIAEHMSDPELDQLVLCRELGMSRAALYNKMKAITGAGAKEYITRIRLEKAKALVETTGLSIVEISEMTGFTSQSYFSTAFKAYTGMTPSQYKKQKASQ